jgi:beta-xylosidase
MNLSIVSGTLYLAGDRKPLSLVEWNTQYESFSIKNDWWFKAGAAVVRLIRTSATQIARATAPASQLAHA